MPLALKRDRAALVGDYSTLVVSLLPSAGDGCGQECEFQTYGLHINIVDHKNQGFPGR